MNTKTKRQKPITMEDLGMSDKELEVFARGAKFLFDDAANAGVHQEPAKSKKGALNKFRN